MANELLKSIFEHHNVDFRDIDFNPLINGWPVNIEKQSLINCSLLTCDSEYFIALNPSDHKFNLPRLNKIIGKRLYKVDKDKELAPNDNIMQRLAQSLNSKDGIHIFVDEALESLEELYLVDDSGKNACAINSEQLHKLSSDELIGISFSEKMDLKLDTKETLSFKERVKTLHSLPPMPETAAKILKLRAIPDIKVEQIVEIIEKDPILVAQIVSYANSAFFGQAGSVKSLKDAIFRVLGVDAVMNMALALSVGSTFKLPRSGTVGSQAVWKSSVYAATLMQRLSMLMPWGERPNPGTAYLIGLLNDIGLLVLGHLFTDEYIELNDYLSSNKDVHLYTAEKNIFGLSHVEVGKMVMRMWGMPDELIEVSAHLHNPTYEGEHIRYVQLLRTVQTLLAPHGLLYGDSSEELSIDALNSLSLEEEDVILAADEVLSEGEIIKNLVKQMCA